MSTNAALLLGLVAILGFGVFVIATSRQNSLPASVSRQTRISNEEVWQWVDAWGRERSLRVHRNVTAG